MEAGLAIKTRNKSKKITNLIYRNIKPIYYLDYMFVSEEFLDFGKSNILEKDIIIVFQTTYPYFLISKP